MLEITSLSVSYGPNPALREVTLGVARGEVLGVIGPNGAGKTTLIRAVSGAVRPEVGEVKVNGRELAGLSPAERARLLAVVPQARRLPASFTVRQTVMLGRTPYLGWLGRPGPDDRARVRWALERTGLLALAERRLGELSGGEGQLVILARALAQDAPILLLDEPTAHLDLQHQVGLLNLVRELSQERGLAVLMALHDLNLVSRCADRVALLTEGRLLACGSPTEVLTSKILSAAYRVSVHVVPHPIHGGPLVLPDGKGLSASSGQKGSGTG